MSLGDKYPIYTKHFHTRCGTCLITNYGCFGLHIVAVHFMSPLDPSHTRDLGNQSVQRQRCAQLYSRISTLSFDTFNMFMTLRHASHALCHDSPRSLLTTRSPARQRLDGVAVSAPRSVGLLVQPLSGATGVDLVPLVWLSVRWWRFQHCCSAHSPFGREYR